jgi:hypothetical protein
MEVENRQDHGMKPMALGSVVDGSATVFGTNPERESAATGSERMEDAETERCRHRHPALPFRLS